MGPLIFPQFFNHNLFFGFRVHFGWIGNFVYKILDEQRVYRSTLACTFNDLAKKRCADERVSKIPYVLIWYAGPPISNQEFPELRLN